MKYLIILLIFITAFTSLQAVTWSRVYGTPDEEIAHVAKQTPDGGYIVLGHRGLYTYQELWILKLDEYGDSIWSLKLDSIHSNIIYFGISDFDIEIDHDSGFIIAINKEDYYGYILRIIKTDKYGNIIWDNAFDVGNVPSFDYPLDLDITSDGGYIVVGNTAGGNFEQFILKINLAGDSIWATLSIDENYLTSVCETPSGDFITTNRGDYHYEKTLMKYNSSGTWIYSVYYDDSYTNDIEMLNDSNYIVATGSNLFKINDNLDSIWCIDIGALDTEPSMDGGFVTVYIANSDAYLNKYNTNGDHLWTMCYSGYSNDAFYSVSRTTDAGYICCGRTESWGAGGYDYYIVKTDSLGYALGIEEKVIIPNPESFNISYISNKNGNVLFNFTLSQQDYVKLEIFDLSGRLISTPVSDNFSEGEHEVSITLPNSGVYIYKFTSSYLEPATVAGKLLVF